MNNKFAGVGVALVTPFDQDKKVDFSALKRLVTYVTEGGVDYLVALGTTAETPTLTTQEKQEVLSFIIECNAGKLPIVCGIGGNDTNAVLQDLKLFNIKGVDGILSVVPYYNKPSQKGIYEHFKAIATSTDTPIILYNVPGRTVTNMLPATTLQLAKEFANIVAIKEASGSLPQCMEIVQGAPEGFAVLSGDDNLVLPQVAIGMHGVISVAANCFPSDFCKMVHSAIDNDYNTARQLHYKLLSKIDLLFAEGNPTGVKCVLHHQGIIQNELRLPLVAASETLSAQLK